VTDAADRPWFRSYEEGVPRTVDVPGLTLPELLDRTAVRVPDEVAVRFFLDPRLPVPALTWGELRERTRRFATALFQLGVRKGDRVAIMLPNCPEFLVAFYGALRIGAIPVNVNPMYVAREMREQLGDSGSETLVLLDPFFPRPKPDVVLEALHRFRPTLFPGVPTLYAGIVDHPRVGEYNLRTGTQCLSGAAPLPGSLVERFEALTGGRLVEGYGLTETAPLTHGNPVHGERRVGSIGVPVPGTDARIVDLATGKPLPPGVEGELEVRGPQVMLGYWNRPAETAETIHDGWLRTGDICRMDADGWFYVVDRRKEMIDASGFKVIPREVEEALLMHPAVQEAVVAGVEDAYRGETVKAFVVLRPGQEATAEEIAAFCRLHLAAFKIPRQVEFRAELPKSLVGKYLRRVLVEEERARLVGPRDPEA
jgi:acyl-CoA synthetase (AMP-forming)/AMP-acid ligase II